MIRRRPIFIQFILLCIIAVPFHVWAGAWTLEPGTAQLILTDSYYNSNKIYTNQGYKEKQATFQKNEISPYMEYGLRDGLTIGGTTSLQYARQGAYNDTSESIHWGIGDTTLFARQRLWQDKGFIVSVEPLLKLSSPMRGNKRPPLGGKYPDAGGTVAAGYGFSALGMEHFVDVQAGYRYRFGKPHNQRRYAATVGTRVTKRVMVMPQIFVTQREQSSASPSLTYSSGDDYNQTTAQLSTVIALTDRVSTQFGGYKHIDGKNTGAGSGILLALWVKF